MTAVAAPRGARRAHQQQVAALLEELEARRRHLYRLKARGARRAGVRDLKCEFESTRRRLLATIESVPAAAREDGGGRRGTLAA